MHRQALIFIALFGIVLLYIITQYFQMHVGEEEHLVLVSKKLLYFGQMIIIFYLAFNNSTILNHSETLLVNDVILYHIKSIH